MNLQNQKWLNALALGSLSLLLLISAILLTPRVQDDSHALTCGAAECEEGYSTGLARTDLNARVASVVSLSAAPSLDFDLTPKAAGEFAESRMKVKVSTNNTSGFSLYLKAMGESNSLVSTDKTNTATISPVASNTASESFSPNTWGYKLATAEAYDPVPVVATAPILNETKINPATGNEYDLAFGVNVDTNLPAGEYTGGVVISAVANPITVTSLYQLTYMQDMTSDICANTTDYVDKEHYATKQLIDTRDGNKYWVAKLADGNCWMVQNLALNITEAGLKASDTDITEDWNQESEYKPVATERTMPMALGADESTNPSASTRSWNFGNYVIGLPELALLCGEKYNGSVWVYSAGLDSCANSGIVNVDGSNWQPNYVAQEGVWPKKISSIDNAEIPAQEYAPNEYHGIIAVDFVNQAYDQHYLTGNYYQWNTATAGTGSTIYGTPATNSICPKNWKLPTAGDNNHPTEGEYYALLDKYGIATTVSGTGIDGEQYHITLVPLYFTRGGAISLNYDPATIGDHTLFYPGSGNRMTTSTPGLSEGFRFSAYELGFNGSTINTVNTHNGPNPKANGRPIRCLAR